MMNNNINMCFDEFGRTLIYTLNETVIIIIN